MQELTQGQGVWKRQPSTSYFTNFQMHSLTLVAKVWYNFLCVKIKPILHLSTVTKDKTILLYSMTKGFQFNIGSFIERGLIESTQGRCTGALIHPSLITQSCRLAEVSMLDSEEQVQQRLPIPLLKAKFGSPGNSDEEADDDVAAATLSEGDPEDGNPEAENTTRSAAGASGTQQRGTPRCGVALLRGVALRRNVALRRSVEALCYSEPTRTLMASGTPRHSPLLRNVARFSFSIGRVKKL